LYLVVSYVGNQSNLQALTEMLFVDQIILSGLLLPFYSELKKAFCDLKVLFLTLASIGWSDGISNYVSDVSDRATTTKAPTQHRWHGRCLDRAFV